MKNLLFGLIATVLLSNLSFGQNLEEKLKNLELKTFKLEQNPEQFDLDDVKSKNNNCDFNGSELYNSMSTIGKLIKEKKEVKANFNDEVVPLINNVQSKLPFNNLKLNETEQLLFDSFIKGLDIKTAIVKSKLYEDFIVENFNEQEQVKNFLIILSEFKYISYANAGKKGFSAWERCVDNCMDDTFSSYNAVDWFFFVAGNPGRGVLQVFASCGWDCY